MPIARRTFLTDAAMASAAILISSTPKAAATPLPTNPLTTDTEKLDTYLAQRTAAGEFSGTVLVAAKGKPVLLKGYGMADRSRNIPNAPRTKFCICSMGKMFTSIGVAQLVERGKLSFDDTIGKYVSGFPADIATEVTIAELLTHTAGMGDVLNQAAEQTPTTLAGLMREIETQPLLFPPGTAYSYSNSGFIVLGAIIQSVSEQPYAEYVHEHVFKRAGMADTAIRVYKPDNVPGMAHGYAITDPTTPTALTDIGDELQIGNPSGGAYSTAPDMLAFAQALTEHRLLSAAMTKTVLAGRIPISRPGGPAGDEYAYGFESQLINNVRIIGHNGGTPGYEGQLDVYIDRGDVVVILTNQDQTMVPAIQESETLLTTT